MSTIIRRFFLTIVSCALVVHAYGQDAHPKNANTDASRFEQFRKTLTGAKLVGQFTVVGESKSELTSEEYHIHEVSKMEEGDYWMFKARIKYGGRDVTVPMPLEVKWAENTPVITLDEVDIPLLGTFSARVVIDGDRYAGTWSHGDVGGHLFGRILPEQAEEGKQAEGKK
jgi:hypothetical protein